MRLSQRWNSLFLAAGVLVLAIALVWLGVASWRNTAATAESGLRARLIDRAFSVRRAVERRPGDEAEQLDELTQNLGWEDGYVHIVSPDGRILASSDKQHDATHLDIPDRRDIPRGEPLVRRHGDDLQVWLRLAAPRVRGLDRKERRRFRQRFPPRLVLVGLPRSSAQDGVERAQIHLGVSIIAALALLILTGIGVRTSRRAARLAVEIERRQRLAALGQLAAILAHEIRTPVAAVRGWAQLLAERLPEDDTRTRTPADRIVRETDRMARLVDDLLGYARPAAPEFRPTDLVALATQCAERLAETAAQGTISLLVDAPDPVTITADADRIAQVLDNLVRNAIEASSPGGTVVVSVGRDRAGARLAVSDRGPGVPDDAKEHIFEPFHTTRASGTGLGLAVARRIADEHRGQLSVSDRPGGGACFTLALPAAPPAPPGEPS